MAAPFIDPRASPEPPYPYERPLAENAGAIAELVQLCRDGRVYAVEAWIKDDRPLWTSDRSRRVQSPLRVAIDTGQYDLAVLLLCNGFLPDTHESLLGHAVDEKALRFIDLLLKWGADALQVDASSVLETYDIAVFDRFWALGLDFTKDHALAHELSRQASNRPLYGWVKRHKDDPRIARELAIALADAITEDRDRATALLLWAGANPHLRVPSLKYNDERYPEDHNSAIEYALAYGKGKLLARLKPDPLVDDFEKLWASACDIESITYLAKIRPPRDWSTPLLRNIRRITWEYGDRWETKTCIEQLARMGARLTKMTDEEIKDLRRSMLRCKEEFQIRWLLRWMKDDAHCDAAIYSELTRTSGMQRLTTT